MTAQESTPFLEPRRRLNELLARASSFEREGFPLGSLFLRNTFEEEARSGSVEGAEAVVGRAATLLELADRRWSTVRKLLLEFDALRDLAEVAGMDLRKVDDRAGNPRAMLLDSPTSETSLDAAERYARLGLTTLREALPPYLVEQARSLGRWAREAEARGEPVREVIAEVGRVVRSLHDLDLRSAASAVGAARRDIARHAGPANVPSLADGEEEAILSEARSLARRLPGLVAPAGAPGRGSEHGALGSAAEAALPSPQDEIDILWAEVDRLVRERELAATGPLLAVAEPALTTSPPVELPAISEEPDAPAEPITVEVPVVELPVAEAPAPSSPAPYLEDGLEPAANLGEQEDLLPAPEATQAPAFRVDAEELLRAENVPPPPEEDASTLVELAAEPSGLTPPVAVPDLREATAGASGELRLASVSPGHGPSSSVDPAGPSLAARTGSPDPTDERREKPRWMSQISISAAYVPPETGAPQPHRAPRPQRPSPRRGRSRHRR